MFRSIAAVLLSSVFFTTTVSAQTDPASLERRIHDLELQLQKLQSSSSSPEIEEMRRQIDILTREIESLKVDQGKEPVQADRAQFGFGAAASKVYRAQPGLSFGGYGEMLYRAPSRSLDNGDPSGATRQLDFTRAILYTGYKFNERVLFNSEIEVEHASTEHGGAVSLEFGYLDYLIRPLLNVRAGVLLMPVGLLNESHEPTSFLGARRPEVERIIIPATWGEAGAGLFGEKGPISYRAYVVTGLNSASFDPEDGIREGRQGGAEASAEDLAAVGRLDWKPVEGILAGGSLYSGGSGQGRGFTGRVTLGEAHAEAKVRGLQLRALYARGSIGDAAAINAANGLEGDESVGKSFGGWYAEAGYDLGGVMNLGQQSITPFVRYENFDTQRSVPAGYERNPGNSGSVITTGFSWKPIPQTVIKLDYQNFDNDANTGTDRFNVGIGYIF